MSNSRMILRVVSNSAFRGYLLSNAYLVHYHGARNHQGLDNKLINPSEELRQTGSEIECREELGGLLKYDYRQAA